MSLRQILLVPLAFGVLWATLPADAQQPRKVPRVGFVCALSGPSSHTEEFLRGLRELGYVEGKNITVEYRFADGRLERFRDFAAELARQKVDIIVAASAQAIQPAKDATRTIPIIMAQSEDPVGSGFVAGLARPGGNLTGLTTMSPELSGKRLELLKDVVPRVSRVAVLWNGANPVAALELRETEVAARALGVKLQPLKVRGPNDLGRAFSAMTSSTAVTPRWPRIRHLPPACARGRARPVPGPRQGASWEERVDGTGRLAAGRMSSEPGPPGPSRQSGDTGRASEIRSGGRGKKYEGRPAPRGRRRPRAER